MPRRAAPIEVEEYADEEEEEEGFEPEEDGEEEEEDEEDEEVRAHACCTALLPALTITDALLDVMCACVLPRSPGAREGAASATQRTQASAEGEGGGRGRGRRR